MIFFLLVSLQTLHCLWSYLIFKMIYEFYTKGKLEDDIRSDEDNDMNEDYTDNYTNLNNRNNSQVLSHR